MKSSSLPLYSGCVCVWEGEPKARNSTVTFFGRFQYTSHLFSSLWCLRESIFYLNWLSLSGMPLHALFAACASQCELWNPGKSHIGSHWQVGIFWIKWRQLQILKLLGRWGTSIENNYSFFRTITVIYRASMVAQLPRWICLQCTRRGFYPWVQKIC